MFINNILINKYVVPYGGIVEKENERIEDIKKTIADTIDLQNNDFCVEVYNMNSELGEYNLGTPNKKLFILNSYSHETKQGGEVTYTKYGITLPYVGDGLLIIDDEGVAVAEYRENIGSETKWNTCQLNILIDAFKDENYYIFKYIMEQFNEKVAVQLKYANSWSKSKNKEALLSNIENTFKVQAENTLRQIKNSIEESRGEIDRYKRNIINRSKALQEQIRKYEYEKNNMSTPTEKLTKDLDLIVKEERVKDVVIEDGLFKVHTNELNIYADNDYVYEGGKYIIKININNGDIRFFGDKPVQGFWTAKDTHPHVDGSTGRACLGNLDSTVAELCSQNQLYPLTLACLDFLESTNTNDPAGKYVVNRNRIDENGEVVKKEFKQCEECGEEYDIDVDFITVYNQINIDEDGDIEYEGEHEVCENCLDGYIYVDDADEYAYEINDDRWL